MSAPAYALDFGSPTTTARCWWEESGFVELKIDVGGKEFLVRKGTEGQSIKGDGVDLKGRAADEWLSVNLGSKDLLKTATWRKQGERGHFFSKNPSERWVYLAKVMRLAAFEASVKSSKKQASLSASLADHSSRELESARKEQVQSPPVPPDPLDLAQAVEADRDAEALVDAVERGDADRQARLLEIAGEAAQLQRLTSSMGTELQDEVRSEQRASGTCPTCGQSTAKQSFCPDRMLHLREAISQARSFAKSLESEAAALRGQAPPLMEVRAIRRAAAEKLKISHRASTQYQAEVKAHSEGAQRRLDRIAAAEVALAEHRRVADEEGDFSTFIRSWSSAYSTELLRDISSGTSLVLERIPNASGIAVEYFLEEESDGTYDVVHRVTIGGRERDDGLSEGQKATVELATDLVVAEVSSGRAHVRPTWMVLDEPFSGLGVRDREAFLELLQERAERNGILYLIVDQHAREFGELFATEGIGIEMSDGWSRIVSATDRASW